MLVYRPRSSSGLARPLFFDALDRLAGSPPNHEALRNLLIDWGEVEAAVGDSLCPERDGASETARLYRRISEALGQMFACSWLGKQWEREWNSLGPLLACVAQRAPAPELECSVAEGYAYYSLYPEQYLKAASAFFEKRRPARAACLGIRSIGSSLSAAVAGLLQTRGCKTVSYCVRPHGHPFSRTLELEPGFARNLLLEGDAWYCIVDEGPGMSGTSLTSVAETLSALGAPDERIVLFPSWEADPSRFVSEDARERWTKHERFTASWLPPISDGSLRDWSGGAWREDLYPNESAYPATQPQHEARKYRVGDLIAKFSGLGRYGEAKVRRSSELEHSLPVREVRDGFLWYQFVPGRPLQSVEPEYLPIAARYLAARRRRLTCPGKVRIDGLLEMTTVNVEEGLGKEYLPPLQALAAERLALEDQAPIEPDGKMMPHKWLHTAKGLVKADALDHCADHFYPGPCDIAWDLAGAAVEFEFTEMQRKEFIRVYAQDSGDDSIVRRLPFYEVAYPAFRLGYVSMAQQTLGAGPEWDRFAKLRSRYSAVLRRNLRQLGAQ